MTTKIQTDLVTSQNLHHQQHADLSVKSLCLKQNGFELELDFELKAGQWLSIVGPSGAGKSTALGCLAGFFEPQSGSIQLGMTCLTRTPPELRPFSYVFQSNALFPFLNLNKNLMLALTNSNFSLKTKQMQISRCLELIKLPESYLKKSPLELSGGELSRANVGRALLQNKPIMLLDEPFAALDEPLRKEMNLLLCDLKTTTGMSLVVVTHHQMDSWLYADQTLVMVKGKVVAKGTAKELNCDPSISDEAASFMGAKALLTTTEGLQILAPISLLRCDSNDAKHCFALPDAQTIWTPQGNFLCDRSSGLSMPLPLDGPFNGKLYMVDVAPSQSQKDV